MSAGDVALVDLHSDPILGIGSQMHGAWLGAVAKIQRASQKRQGPGGHC